MSLIRLKFFLNALKKTTGLAVRNRLLTLRYCETSYSQILYARTANKEFCRDHCHPCRAERL